MGQQKTLTPCIGAEGSRRVMVAWRCEGGDHGGVDSTKRISPERWRRQGPFVAMVVDYGGAAETVGRPSGRRGGCVVER